MLNAQYLRTVSHEPGVYMMLDKRSAALYVGKAKNLHKRLSSWLRPAASDHNRAALMLRQVSEVNTIITRTEKEALILEASLIKQHKPKYNIILRDDKTYPHIKVTVHEEWPRVMMTRRKKKDGARYFGPYSSVSSMWTTLKFTSSLFPLRRCKGAKIRPRKRPCLNFQMGRCCAPCSKTADRTAYAENVRKTLMLLEGRNAALLSRLKGQMRKESDRHEFERAAATRDTIRALERTTEKQMVAAAHNRNQDVFGFRRRDAAVSAVILCIRKGIITGSRSFFLKDSYGDDQALLAQMLGQFYFHGANLPEEIILPFDLHDRDLFSEYFTELADARVRITVPRRGD